MSRSLSVHLSVHYTVPENVQNVSSSYTDSALLTLFEELVLRIWKFESVLVVFFGQYACTSTPSDAFKTQGVRSSITSAWGVVMKRVDEEKMMKT